MNDKATKISDIIGSDFIEIGELLWEIQEDDPEQFVKIAEGLGVGLRKAYYLVSVAKTLKPFNLDRDQLRRIGWTKLELVSKSLDSKNYKILLAQAEALPVHELKDILAGKHAVSGKRCVLLYFQDAEYALFRDVLKTYGATEVGKGLQDKEAALILALKAVSAGPVDQ